MKRVTTVVTVVGGLLIAAAAFAQQAQQPPPPPPVEKPAAPTAQAPAPAKPFPEGSKIAFIDVQQIASESTEGKAAAAKITGLQQKRTKELEAKNKTLETAQQKLSAGGVLMSEEARAQLQKEIDKQQVDIQRAQQDAQAELDELNRQLQIEFQRKLAPVIQQVSAERGVFILFSRSDSGIVWVEPTLDLTAEIVRRFNAAVATAKPAKGPQP